MCTHALQEAAADKTQDLGIVHGSMVLLEQIYEMQRGSHGGSRADL